MKFPCGTLLFSLLLPILFLLPQDDISNHANGFSFSIVDFQSPTLHTVNGEEINTAEVGKQSIIGVSSRSYSDEEQSFVILIEVRDGNGVARDIFWQSTQLNAQASYTMETSWTPSKDGMDYQVRVFAITGFDNPQVLSSLVVSENAITVIKSPYQSSGQTGDFMLTLDTGQSYYIEYASETGRVNNIEGDISIRTLTVNLEGVKEDGNFTIRLPSQLIYRLFSFEQGRGILEGDEGSLPAVFVDEAHVQDVSIIDVVKEEFVKVRIPVPAGAKQIVIAGDLTDID